jgi:5-methylcytosine-specific restriction endonuclease McrA
MKQQKDRRHELRERLDTYRSALKCQICSEGTMCCLDFHHTNPKSKDINPGDMVGSGWSWERMMKEIDKCIVLCANCHRKVHANIIQL